MPNGKGCRQRQSERFRVRKGDEFMATIRAKMFKDIGIEFDSTGMGEDEVLNFGNNLVKLALKNNAASAAVLACDVYRSDTSFVEALQLEEVIDNDYCVIPVSVEVHEFHHMNEDYSTFPVPFDEVKVFEIDYQSCDSVMNLSVDKVVRPIQHEDHFSHDVYQNGDGIIRRCDQLCDGCTLTSDLNGQTWCSNYEQVCVDTTVIEQCVYPSQATFDPFIKQRIISGQTCRCVYTCTHFHDRITSVKRCRNIIKGFNYSVYQAMLQVLPFEVISKVEQYLNCREKFMLMLKDGLPRLGCTRQRLTVNQDSYCIRRKCNYVPFRCICHSIIYQHGCKEQTLRALPFVGIGLRYSDKPVHFSYHRPYTI